MRRIRSFNDGVTIGGSLEREEMCALARGGCETIIDLRTGEEPSRRGLRPSEEREWAEALGVEYIQIPVSVYGLDRAVVIEVRAAVRRAARPLHVHCASGNRAGVFALLCLPSERTTADQRFATGERLGLEWAQLGRLREFFADYVHGVARPAAA